MDTGSPWSAPSGGAWTYDYLGSMTAAPVVLQDGRIVFPTKSPDFVGSLVCVDPQFPKNPLSWTRTGGLEGNYVTPACMNDGVLYIGTDENRIAAISPDDGGMLWSFATRRIVTQLTAAPGLILFGTVDDVQALDLATRTLRWKVSVSPSSPYTLTRVAVRGDQAVWGVTATKGARGSIHCHDLESGGLNWVTGADGPVSSDPIAAAGWVFFGTANGLLSGYDRHHHPTAQFQLQTGGAIVGAAACDERHVYVGSTDGTFYAKALQPDIQPQEWQVPVTGSIGTHVVVSGGDACFGGINANGQTAFYALDLASAENQSARVLVDTLQNRLLISPEASRGQIAFSDGDNKGGRLYAIHMDEKGMLDRVSFSASLMIDEYDLGSGQAVPAQPSFQMSATILDDQLAPMPDARVALWASTPISLVCNGIPVHLGATSGEAVSVQADAAGFLSMTAPGDVGMPSLFLRPDFFLPSYSLEVFPDQQNLDRLAHVTGDELKNARGYDQQGVLLATYAESSDAVASSVRNTIGRRQNTGAAAFSTSSTGAPSAAQRGLNAGEVPSWITEINPDRVTFDPLQPSEIELWFGANRQVTTARQGFGSFVKNVVKGTEKAAKVVWHHTGEVANVIVQTAEAEYEFFAETVEQAVQVVKTVVDTVVTSIEKFIEWLSFLFAWDDIVATQRALASHIESSLTALTSWLDGQIATGEDDCRALIENWKSSAAAAFHTVTSQVAGTTPGSSQHSAGPLTSILHPGGIDITVPSQWLMKKVSANATIVPQLPGADELVALFNQYLDDLKMAVQSNPALQQLPDDLEAVMTSFTKLCTDPGGFAAQAMDAVVGIFGDLVDAGLTLLETMIGSLLAFLREAVRLLRKILTAKIDIPFVSDFYRIIAGSDLTMLNLVTLGLAVPTTMIYKIEHGRAPVSAGNTEADIQSAEAIVTIAYAVAYFPMLPLWVFFDQEDPSKPNPPVQPYEQLYRWIIAGDSFAMLGLGLYLTQLEQPTTPDWVFTAIQSVQPIVYTVDASLTGEKRKNWNKASAFIYAGVGASGAVPAVVYAGLYPDGYWDDGKTFLSNFLSNLPYFSGVIRRGVGSNPESQAVAELIISGLSLICYGTAGGLFLWEEFVDL